MGQLWTFQPYSGPKGSPTAANTYYLPPQQVDADTRSLEQSINDKVVQPNGDGSFLGMGSGAPMITGGVIDFTMFITYAWLRNNNNLNYSPDSAGMHLAQYDFAQWVEAGGLGILLDRYWNGASYITKTCTARLEGNPRWHWNGAYSKATLAGQFFSPYGRWTESDGATLTLFR